MDEERMRQIALEVFKELSSKGQFTSGPIPVHTHNGRGNDAPQIPFIGLADTPTSYHGKAGNVAVVNSTESGLKFSGIPAGGINTEVQFNDNGVLNGDIGLEYDKVAQNLGVFNIVSNLDPTQQQDLTITAEAGGNLTINANDSQDSANQTGNVLVTTASGDGGPNSLQTGNVSLVTGDTSNVGNELVGNINLTSGNGHRGSNIFLTTGTTSAATGSNITLTAHGNSNSQIVLSANDFLQLFTGRLIIIEATDEIRVFGNGNGNVSLFASGGGSFGSGVQVLFIGNATTVPTTNPSGGGILYITAGGLVYRGSAGTVTPIAPA